MIIEELKSTESTQVLEILWTALNIPGAGRKRSILYDPAIRAYYKDWGRAGDRGFAAVSNDHFIGAAWCRIKGDVSGMFPHYPELVIGVLPEYQNAGTGSLLMKKLIEASRGCFPGLRLGIHPKNERIITFYERFGFEIYDYNNKAPQMIVHFDDEK